MKLYDDYFDLCTGNLIVQPHATVHTLFIMLRVHMGSIKTHYTPRLHLSNSDHFPNII